ncbi:Zinc-binding alcohol dehydrogenase domain-containing protein cipB, partial [Penicillium subrubescens]
HLHSPKTGEYANSSFQLYPVASERLTAAIPASLSFEQASVLPLSISTAAAGLYLPGYLGLPLPSSELKTTSETLLVWGGASSVGMAVIQLAVASGLKVVTTASTSNHCLLQSLGADAVFDYKSESVVEDISNNLKNSNSIAIYDAIGEERSFEPLRAIVKYLHGPVKIASVLPCNKPSENFNPKFITSYGIAYPPNENVGEKIWGDFVPNALASGKLQAKPDPIIVGHGLEELQKGLDLQKAGVSAKKLVIML